MLKQNKTISSRNSPNPLKLFKLFLDLEPLRKSNVFTAKPNKKMEL